MTISAANSSSETFFAAQANDWDARYESRTYRQRRALVRQIVATELDRIGRDREVDVLDFGCGSGVALSDLLELGVKATGVDNSRAMIEKAHARFAPLKGQVDLEWLQNTSGAGKYENRSYQIVLCTSVLEFVPDIEPVLSRLCSIVRPGGMLLVTVPNRGSVLRKAEGFILRHPRPFRLWPQFKHLTQPESYLNYQLHQLTVSELASLVESYGLKRESYSFRVAPRLPGFLERSESLGMMLMAVFRK